VGGWWVPRLDRPLSRFFFWSLFTSLFALILARLPGLFPVLSASAPRSLLKSGPFAGRIPQARHLKRAALWKAVGAVGAAGIMVTAAFAGMPSVVHQPVTAPHPILNNLPANTSTPFFPYLVSDPSLYPTPEEIALPGNASYPQMVATVDGGLPTLHLLAIVNENGTFHPVLLSGSYSEDLAREIQDGNACPSHSKHGDTFCTPPSLALSWSQPLTLTVGTAPATLSGPPTGTALLISGQDWAVAASTRANQTALWVSTDGGVQWASYPAQSGGDPHLLTLNGTLTLVTSSPTGVHFTSLLPDGSVDRGSFTESLLSASSVLLPSPSSGPLPTLGVIGVSPQGSVSFDRLSLSGTLLGNTTIGSAPLTNASPIFRQIGNTALSPPGGIPGQVTALSTGNTTFVLWTASVENRVVALTTVSGNAGENWSGPYVGVASLGSLADPTAILSPAGYVLVDWRSSTGGIDLEPYGLDGRALSPAIPVSPPCTATLASPPVLAVDSLERPFFAWTGANNALQVTGALLHAPQAVEAMLQAVQALRPADFVNGTNASQAPLEQKLQALLNMVSGPGSSTGAIQKLEQDLYPKITTLPLNLGCSGANPVCGHIHKGKNPSWILNETGPLAANTYLAIYAEWVLEALGVTAMTPPAGDAFDVCSPPTAGGGWVTVTCPVNWVTSNGTASGTSGTTLNPLLDDPTTAELDLNDSFPTLTLHGSETIHCTLFGHKVDTTVNFTFNASPEWMDYQVSTTSGNASIPQGGDSAIFYLRNLPVGTPTYFNVTETPHYVVNVTSSWTGNGRCFFTITAPPPPSISVQIPSLVDPVENFTPGPHLVVEAPCSVCTDNYTLSLNGTATMPSETFANATPTTGGTRVRWMDTSYLRDINVTATGFSAVKYDMSGDLQSKPGNTTQVVNTTATPEIFIQKGLTGSTPLHVSFGCNFTVVPSNLGISNFGVSDITQTTATVTWDTTVGATSEVALTEVGVGGTRFPSVPGNTTHHVVPLSGLDPFALYHLRIITGIPSTGCLGVEIETPVIAFNTTATFSLGEFDLAYDSITKEGGGAVLIWDVPSFVLSRSYSNFTSGAIEYSPTSTPSNVTIIPIENLSGGVLLQYGSKDLTAFDTTLSILSPNTNYDVRVLLNFTLGGSCSLCHLTAQSQPFSWVYLKDTSGDGLSDAEKTYGWFATYTGLSGRPVNLPQILANKDLYATNGLVSDYVEKEFALNAATLDTAGSHMLDTWNLTFAVPSTACPSGFECWNESRNSQWDPFDFAQTPQGAAPGNLSGSAPGNFTQGSAGFNGPDSSPWGSAELWSYGDLQTLQGLIAHENVGWLRGVLSDAKGVGPALTVWGKLSWGANPLAVSTPNDGIPDGARLDPLYDLDLQLGSPNTNGGAHPLYGDVRGCPSGLTTGDGIAIRLYVNTTSAAGNLESEFSGYTAQANIGKCSNFAMVPDSSLTIPVDNTVQDQKVVFQMVVNTSTSSTPQLEDLTVNGSQQAYGTTIDLLAPPPTLPPVSGSGGPTPPADLYLGDVSVVPAQMKASTYLWVPDDNSTLTKLPPGLQRYAGEQNFFLVVANMQGYCPYSSCSITSHVLNPWGGYYSMGVSQSNQGTLTNFLIPRGQFLASPLGQMVLQNATASSPNYGRTSVPVWNYSMRSLECYWAARAWTGGCGAVNDGSLLSVYSPESTTNGSTPLNCTQTPGNPNCAAGGVPSNPALETSCSGCAAPALQAVLTVNITSQQDLDALVAGLLDNTTLGVNGTFLSVTGELSTLGLNAAVMSALVNSVVNSTGVFGAPVSTAQPPSPPPPSCSGLWCVWNTVSGIVTSTVGAIVGVVWDATVAASAFFDEVAQGLVAFAENPVGATVAALKAVGHALEAALQDMVTFVVFTVEELLRPVWRYVTSGATAYFAGIQSAYGNLNSAVALAISEQSSANIAAAEASGLTMASSVLDAQSLASIFLSDFEQVATTIQPILTYLSVPGLMNAVMSYLEQHSPLGGVMNLVDGLFNGGISSIVSALRSLLIGAGLETPVPSILMTPTLSEFLGSPDALSQFLDAYGLPPPFSNFVKEYLSQISNPPGYLDFELTGVSTVAWAISLDIAGGLGITLAGRVLNVFGIGLTALGLGLFGVGGFCDDIWSVWSDLGSIDTDILDLLTQHPSEAGVIADMIDVGADEYDIALSYYSASTLEPHSCFPL
jgi:hypothetical protein